jgi:hypothetical protein
MNDPSLDPTPGKCHHVSSTHYLAGPANQFNPLALDVTILDRVEVLSSLNEVFLKIFQAGHLCFISLIDDSWTGIENPESR